MRHEGASACPDLRTGVGWVPPALGLHEAEVVEQGSPRSEGLQLAKTCAETAVLAKLGVGIPVYLGGGVAALFSAASPGSDLAISLLGPPNASYAKL